MSVVTVVNMSVYAYIHLYVYAYGSIVTGAFWYRGNKFNHHPSTYKDIPLSVTSTRDKASHDTSDCDIY